MRRADLVSNLLLIVAGIAGALVVAEVGLRAYYLVRTHVALSGMAEATGVETIHTGFGQLGAGVRASERPNVVYELRPNLRGIYDGRRFATNRFGFRQDRDIALAKPEGGLRIVGIGDSWMWGSGVNNGETYLDRLHERLTSAGVRVETINTGVWGYNAIQEVATLRWKGLVFRPDVVVVGLCGNDRAFPDFLNERPFVELSRSFLWNEVRGRLGLVGGDAGKEPTPTSAALMPHGAFSAAYAELSRLSESEGFDVVVFSDCFGPGSEQVPYCSLGDANEWRDFLARLDRWGFRRCPWEASKIPQNPPDEGGHASAEGNEMLAAILEECIRPFLAKRVRH